MSTAPRSPWQNGYAERLIGSIRRECLEHIIVLNKAHLIRALSEYFEYYDTDRPHQSPDGNSPRRRALSGQTKAGLFPSLFSAACIIDTDAPPDNQTLVPIGSDLPLSAIGVC